MRKALLKGTSTLVGNAIIYYLSVIAHNCNDWFFWLTAISWAIFINLIFNNQKINEGK